MSWHRNLMVGFDLETTGTDPLTARIVTAALVEVADGELVARHNWLVDPGVPIPEEAVRIHGVTNERARSEGEPAAECAARIARRLARYFATGTPVVAFNAAFDFSVLSAELVRHGLPSLERLSGGVAAPILDPLTIDRRVDRYRRGSRNLEAVCREYGVTLEGAHEAGADALAAVQVMAAIAGRYPEIRSTPPAELHRSQIAWYAEWATGYQAYLRRTRDPLAVVDTLWPVRTA
ncbi:3'-5' exonuclease [Allostreptomyces psammosilenae]|uniref:DNA polymerase-3 subunit epsilon n=1 Tax=Allostreptomyces psammosilenae TaxID=1892865 RepID=A0A852ZPS6_9ACTN|nr:3'-5' exonuclease [Allostreptomyces psammosilenae]NYI03260.1 DNA polymerase-3 subunit epsilon [Allostreptomyces psammosilenae]